MNSEVSATNNLPSTIYHLRATPPTRLWATCSASSCDVIYSLDTVNTGTSPTVVTKGRVDVRALMPNASTALNRIDILAATARAKLVPRVRLAIRDGRCQVSTDMWTDDEQKQHFVAITVSFVDEKGQACETHDLVTAKFPSRMKVTGVNVRRAMQQAMADIGIPRDEFEKIEWVTDRGANIKKALEDLPRYVFRCVVLGAVHKL